MTFSREEKLKEIAREIEMRRSLYRKWVKDHRMRPEEAERRVAIMVEIAKDYGGHGDEQ